MIVSGIENTLTNQELTTLVDRISEEKVPPEQKKDSVQEGDVMGVEDLQDINLEMDDNTVDNQGHTELYIGAIDGCIEIVPIFFRTVPSQNLRTVLGGHHCFYCC